MRYLLTGLTLLFILLALIGQVIRDITVELGILMYIPVLPLGLWVIVFDLLQFGRSLPRFRFSLTFIGVAITIWGILSMVGFGGLPVNSEIQTQPIKILHWNVWWGGRGVTGWDSIQQDIQHQHPDIVIISEPPVTKRFNQLLQRLGSQWSVVKYRETKGSLLVVGSSWPLQLEQRVKIHNAAAMTVSVRVHNHFLRILAIDGHRNMSRRYKIMSKSLLPRWRTPMLNDMAQFLATRHNQGQPVDIIVGDFNALSRSLGFKAFDHVGGGYYLGSQYSFDWRGSWTSFLPLYDIDHIWVHKRFQGLKAGFLTNFASDHRGQWVQFYF